MVRKIFFAFSLILSILFGSEKGSQEVFGKMVSKCDAILTRRGEIPPECVPVLFTLFLSTLSYAKGDSAEKSRKEVGKCITLLMEKRRMPPECWLIIEKRKQELRRKEERRRRFEAELRKKISEAKEVDYRLLESTLYRVGNEFVSFVSVEVPFEEAEIIDWSGSRELWLCLSGKKINFYRHPKNGDLSVEAVVYLSDKRLSWTEDIPYLPERLYKLVIKETPEEEREFKVKISKEGEITRISLPVEVFSLHGGLYLGPDLPITEKVCEAKLLTLKSPVDILRVEVMPGVKTTIDVTGLLKKNLKLNNSEELK